MHRVRVRMRWWSETPDECPAESGQSVTVLIDDGPGAPIANSEMKRTDAAWFDPDPKSKSGRSVRVIGYSGAAGMCVTVIPVSKGEGEWWGVNACTANTTDARTYREGRT